MKQQSLNCGYSFCQTLALSISQQSKEQRTENGRTGSIDNCRIPAIVDEFCSPFVSISKAADLTGQIEKTSTRPIGGGCRADVYQGHCRRANGNVVAIKAIRFSRSDIICSFPDKQKLLREAEVLARLNHPNIIPFYGVWYDPDSANAPCFITPHFSNGNICAYLKQNRNADRLQLTCQIAAGLVYLHGIQIVHGDIKSTNVLINDEGEACLADFGLRLALERSGFSISPRGSLRWTAPELCIDEYSRVTSATDVWAFSMTVLEIFTGRLPFFPTRRDETAMYQVTKGQVPSQGDYFEVGDDVWCILEKCWNFDPAQRPPIQNLSVHLNILAAHRLHDKFSRSPDVAPARHQQLFPPPITRRGSTAVCFSKPRAILHTVSARSHGITSFLFAPRRRSKSLSEGVIHPLTVNDSPYPCQWENCQAQFDVLIDCQVHELRHKQALVGMNLAP